MSVIIHIINFIIIIVVVNISSNGNNSTIECGNENNTDQYDDKFMKL